MNEMDINIFQSQKQSEGYSAHKVAEFAYHNIPGCNDLYIQHTDPLFKGSS